MRRLTDAAITEDAFDAAMAPLGPFESAPHIAVGVSGGPDSMALALLLDGWTRRQGGMVTALTVDHGLRPESADEAAQTGARLRARGITHQILHWDQGSAARDTRIQERARAARYDLLEGWCAAHGILHLAVAHHRQDNAETVLLRFARGSGPHGLAAMPPVRETPRVRLLRPLLGFDRAALVAHCQAMLQPFVSDRSNRDQNFARPRLRAARDVLAAEGMSDDRLNLTARRCAEARSLIEAKTAKILAEALSLYAHGYAVLDTRAMPCTPERQRALGAVLATIGGQSFAPKLEKLDAAVARLDEAESAAFTLAGCLLHPLNKRHWLICREAAACESRALEHSGSTLWDGRFALTWHGLPATRYCTALGEAGWAQAKAAGVAADLPRLAALTLPAIWHGNRLESVPPLKWRLPDASSSVRIKCWFRPRTPLTAAPVAIVRL